MTNAERKEKRFQRRKAIRLAKKEKFLNNMPTYDEVFTYEHLWSSFWLCRQDVSWKPSIQMYQQNLNLEIVKIMNELKSDQGFHSRGFIEFNICERGKMRHIKSVDIRERVVQRCFCDYYLVPLLTRNLIYNNGASLKNKGVAFSLNRLKQALKQYYKKYHTNEGYIVLYDFSNYFGNIDHKKLYNMIDPLIKDEKCKKLFHHLIDVFGDNGLGLGSQVSQVSAVSFPNKLDQTFMNLPIVENYARYMDDGYIITHTKRDAEKSIQILIEQCKKLNIILNPKKIRICKLNHYFTYIKKRFCLTKSGKSIMKLNRNNIFKHKRRINKLLKLVKKNKLTKADVILSHKSWYGQVKNKYYNRKAIYNIHLEILKLIENF